MPVDVESTGCSPTWFGDLDAVTFDTDVIERPVVADVVDGAIKARTSTNRYVHAGSAVKDDAGLTARDPRRPRGTDVFSITGDDVGRNGSCERQRVV